ncbi:malto-oligosyltrehalose trehalohydrolase [Kozakia baliensis]|uniref:malto-oligosyltrehalose trehalohydrolase n=1 Tax=Kozakia baliensis TaxID=153496 RepID=UPI00345C513A
MSAFRYHNRFGAELRPNGVTRFSFWAPACETVTLEIENLAPLAMTRDEHGIFTLEAPCGAGARYRYRVNPDLAVADPASRDQPDGVHGPSVVVDPTAYSWRNNQWLGKPWEEAVIYELHAGLLGGFAGIRTQLEELVRLGITAIEIMPINSFGGTRNWGYDGVLPYAPAAAYGSPDDLKALIDQAHELGLMVFLDVVYNHLGPDGNYLPIYATDFFDHDNNSTWGTGIAFARDEVAQFFIDNVLYWAMEYRFDGVRIDAASAITDHAWFGKLLAQVREKSETGRHVHLILENENNDAGLLRDGFTAQWNDDVHNVLHVLLTGEQEGYYEMFSERPIEILARVLEEGFAYQGEINPYSGKKRGMPSSDLPPTKFIFFLQNHDQTGNRAFGERLISLANPEALHAAYALMFLCPMVPMLFMGEEWGSTSPFQFFCDFHDELADQVREGRRKEFAKFKAFNDAESRARIPDPNALSTFENSRPNRRQRDTPQGKLWLERTAELLALRRHWITSHLDNAYSIGASVIGDKAVMASWKLGNGDILHVALNLDDDLIRFSENDALIYSTAEDREAGTLPPRSFVAWVEIAP